MAPNSLASIHPVYSGVNTRNQNGCHAPLISGYSCVREFLHTSECLGDTVTLELTALSE